MESIEVWMWVIAGLLVGSLIFISGSSLLARYLGAQEIGVARDNFQDLVASAEKVCRLGLYSQETRALTFPFATNKITVEDAQDIEGSGNKLCLYLRGEDFPDCRTISSCVATMNSVQFDQHDSPFYILQQLTGQNKAAKIQFAVRKTDYDLLEISWEQQPLN